LSRIERDAEQKAIERRPTPIQHLLQSAIQACEVPAQTKSIRIELSCGENLMADVNAQMLEQAVINLIDNAIKYSEEARTVQVHATKESKDLVIRVADQGSGISKEHHDRIFERFYRVDRGRSRAMGGTGLGLAIVKHIALAHGGKVAVESEPGKGSIFAIYIPSESDH
jgi:two-component system phosphate regulon sensor histidine kinase PhoR